MGIALLTLSSLGVSAGACDNAIETNGSSGAGATGAGGAGGSGGADGACEAPLAACGDACVDTRYDPAHCGACGNTCPANSACLDGTCTKGPNADGEHCASNEDCNGGVCLTEDEFGLAKGMCASLCNPGLGIDCPDPATVCSEADGVCLKLCKPGSMDCPADASECVTSEDAPDEGFCLSNCTTNDDCPALGKCNTKSGRCEPPEDCKNEVDDDQDGLLDCEDDECSSTTACQAVLEGACMDPGKAVDGYAGDTTTGTSVFFGSCTGSNGAKEEVLAFTSGGTDAVTRIAVTSIVDLGFYVRTSCSDAASEQLCSDLYDSSQPEQNFLYTKGNTTYDLIVDGFDADQAGKYGLAMASLSTVTEVEPNATAASATVTMGSEGGLIGTIAKGDQDYYQVTVPSAGKLFVQTTGGDGTRCGDGVIPAPAVDTEVEVFDGDGTKSLGLADDISGGLFGPGNFCTIVAVDLPAAGTYFVRIAASQDYCKDCEFNYAAAFEFTPSPT